MASNPQLSGGRELSTVEQKQPFLGSLLRRIISSVNSLASNAVNSGQIQGAAAQVLATPTTGSGAATPTTLTSAYLPAATADAIGAVKPDGTTITVAAGGVLSAAEAAPPSGPANHVYATPNGSAGDAEIRALVPADLPVATTSALGAVQPDGSTITISAGIISATGGGGGGSGLFAPILSNVPTQASMGFLTSYNPSSSFTVADTAMGVTLFDPIGVSGDQFEGIAETYPATPFTLTALLVASGIPQNLYGFSLLTSLTGSLQAFFVDGSSGWLPRVDNYSDPFTFNSSVANGFLATLPYVWFRFQDDGANFHYGVSFDGISWLGLYSVAKASAWVPSPAYMAFTLGRHNNQGGMTIVSYKLTTP